MRLPFRIFTVQNDGHLHLVDAVSTLDEAKTRVSELGEAWPGEYVIDNEEPLSARHSLTATVGLFLPPK